jgi:alginate O-acetyltransferase complex protein AlgJ
MIRNNKYAIFFSTIFIGICFPLVQMLLRIIPENTLTGVQKLETKPEISIHDWLTGNFQTKCDTWFRQNFGLRDSLIRINNQIYYSCFQEITNNQIIAGKNNQLYSTPYVLWYRKLPPFTPIPVDSLELKVKEISELQNLLKRKGIYFLVLITPSITSIYPEYIPDRYKENKVFDGTNYDNFIPLLNKYQIYYLDTNKLLLLEKKKNSYPFFPRGGIHWNQLGCFIATNAFIKKLQDLTGKDIQPINCTKITIDKKPLGSDKDLVELLNLVKTPTNYIVPHLNLSTEPNDKYVKFNILFEGGSFTFGMLDILYNNSIFKKMSFYFYYHDKYSYPQDGTNGVIDKNIIDWERDIFKNDIIILELNQFAINANMGSGFIQDAIRELKQASN